MHRKSVPIARAFAALLLVCISNAALAQNYPSKSIHFVVPYAAGGAVDAMARVFAQKYAEAWGQPVLVANEVQFAVVPSQTALAHIKAGKLKVLAVTNARRSSALPEVPTVSEAGLPGYEFGGWTGLFTTGGTPRDIIRKIADETAKLVRSPDVTKYFAAWGVESDYRNTEDFTARYLADIDNYTRIIREAKIPLVD
jgi:tripartite-type tricarboxylate transporter receptor subunit TctC